MGSLKKNVFLVGFMGVGKTTVARRMARDMGVACVDVDAYLLRSHGKTAAEIFGEQGEDALRNLETEALRACVAMGPCIISCGEGIVARPENRAILKRDGFAVMLESSEATSLGRIRNLSTRPLLAHDCDIDGLWEQRKPLYEEVARAKIDVQGRSTYSVASFIAKVLSRAGVYTPEEEDAVAKKVQADKEKRRRRRHSKHPKAATTQESSQGSQSKRSDQGTKHSAKPKSYQPQKASGEKASTKPGAPNRRRRRRGRRGKGGKGAQPQNPQPQNPQQGSGNQGS